MNMEQNKNFFKKMGFPGGLEGKASTCNEGDPGSIPELGRSPGEGNGNPLQYSCLENPIDGGAWEAAVHGVAKSQTRLSNFAFLSFWKQKHHHKPSWNKNEKSKKINLNSQYVDINGYLIPLIYTDHIK